MAQLSTYFLKLDGISGEGTDPDHAGWIDVESYTFETPQSGRGGAGRFRTQDFSFSSLVGRHSVELSVAGRDGRPIRFGVLEIVRGSDGEKVVAVRVRFTDLLVKSYQTFPNAPPRDVCTLNFASVQFESGGPAQAARTVQPVYRPLLRSAATRRGVKR